MRTAKKIAVLLAGFAMTACASAPDKNTPLKRISPDYMASETTGDTRAYIYGGKTVVELLNEPSFFSIKNEAGESVQYEKIGRHYRLKQRLDNFTVTANGRTTAFSAIPTTKVFSAPESATEKSEPVILATLTPPPANRDNTDALALIKLADAQLLELRKAIDAASKNPKTTGATLFKISERLDEIKARYITASAAMIQVRFATSSTALKLTPDVENVLLKSAKGASRINLRGYTDSRVAGSQDARIALGRAMAVRKLLVDGGIQNDKINVTAQADGAFIVPNTTKKGRALNRRAEIEFIDARIGELKGGVVMVAASKVK